MRKYFRLASGVARTPVQGFELEYVDLSDEATKLEVGGFCQAVREKVKDALPEDLRASALKVLTDENARPLTGDASIASYGTSAQAALIVVVPEVWFKLVYAGTGAVFTDTRLSAVLLAQENTVKHLQDAVFDAFRTPLRGLAASQLRVYEDFVMRRPLKEGATLGAFGRTEESALIVAVPRRRTFGAPEPTSIDFKLDKDDCKDNNSELQRYQQQGQLIQASCHDYCN
ncbi:hypothetical protein PHYPSEUDO_007763 [Phytophthora pseudosyringae]|uniref:Uncharacterized protein n=1 Tax=Phytophthora pseudosyringae TaxID=221518 RepID=A0A8T1VIT2_9STRA|nr:hypothetical protein PHYPSEUDO_007763 [Phytophthora pseudosyringae]